MFVNEAWYLDRDDKWAKYGIFLHTAVDLGSGRVMWAKYWWTLSDPARISLYFIEAARKQSCMKCLLP